jgi:hypothetical protein
MFVGIIVEQSMFVCNLSKILSELASVCREQEEQEAAREI